MAFVRANQNPDSPVSTRPLWGISVGSRASKVEIRSLATSSSRSASSSNSSRTFPLPTWVAASGMDGILLPGEGGEPLEDDVDVPCGPVEVEERVEVGPARDLGVGAHELTEILLLLLGLQRVALD